MRKVIRIMSTIFVTATILWGMTGCIKPYNTPQYVVIEPSQTAFLIPLIGDSSNQANFESEQFLENSKVATKEVQIPRRWVQTGRMSWTGEYRDTMRLVVVERKPETREWTESSGASGLANQGIIAQSKESISFKSKMNISAQIDESDATRFLYRYNNKPLSEILDFEIRARIEGLFVEICSRMTIDEIRVGKENIMTQIREDVIPYFKDRGINITTIGLKGDFEYLDASIQESINKVFKASQDLITQNDINAKMISEAEAKASAAKMEAQGIAEANRIIQESLTADLIEYEKINKWDGQLPQIQGATGVSPIIDFR